MKILGYSERGVTNSLFYDMSHSIKAARLLANFLKICKIVPAAKCDLKDIEVLIEQSFSDFGDADAVILAKNGNRSIVVFIEAKVAAHEKSWSIKKEYEHFENGVNNSRAQGGFASNLFTQLYHKSALIRNEIDDLKSGVEQGVFMTGKKMKSRTIGNNITVRAAIDKIIKRKPAHIYYLGIVPVVNDWTIQNKKLPGAQNWDKFQKKVRFVDWATVERFCRDNKKCFVTTLSIFEYNAEQIYFK